MSSYTPSVLILDDDPQRHAAFVKNNPDCQITSVYTCQDAVTAVYDTHFDIICFDHDLGETPGGEYETSVPFARVVRQLIDDEAILDNTVMLVHTSNPVGAQDIMSYFARTMNPTFKFPWAWTKPGLFHMMLTYEQE